MTSDPAHPPRPGEGTGPLPPLTTEAQPAHTTGPLPPLPESHSESAFRRSLRQQLPAINEGRVSLREGLGTIISTLLQDVVAAGEVPSDAGPVLLQEIPDAVIRHWLGKVAKEQVAFEVFLGALTAEGLASKMRKAIGLAAELTQQRVPGTEDANQLEVINAAAKFDELKGDFRQVIGELVATRATEELRAGLDAQTANQLVTLLKNCST